MKLPRKLKKRLKAGILKKIDPAWKSNELKILDYRMYRGKKKVTSYTLGL